MIGDTHFPERAPSTKFLFLKKSLATFQAAESTPPLLQTFTIQLVAAPVSFQPLHDCGAVESLHNSNYSTRSTRTAVMANVRKECLFEFCD
jgi:hypothetical protein